MRPRYPFEQSRRSPESCPVPRPSCFLSQWRFLSFRRCKSRLLQRSHKLAKLWIVHRSAQAMAHIEGRLVRTGTDDAVNLQGAHSLLESASGTVPKTKCAVGISYSRKSFPRSARNDRHARWRIRRSSIPTSTAAHFVNRLRSCCSAGTSRHSGQRRANRYSLQASSVENSPLKLRPSQLRRELWVMAFRASFSS